MNIISIEDIVPSLLITRIEFSDLFVKAQLLENFSLGNCITFDALPGLKGEDRNDFQIALKYAGEKGFMKSLLLLIITGGFETGEISKTYLQKNVPAFALHKIMNAESGFLDPKLFSKKTLKIARAMGQVHINKTPAGTGILIGPNLFLTSWHVLESLFVATVKDGLTVYKIKSKHPTLSVAFSHLSNLCDDNIITCEKEKVNAHMNWLVCYSACHEEELAGRMPDPLHQLSDYVDYVIIRLDRPVGYERGWVKPERLDEELTIGSKIVLFQYPKNVSLKMDYSSILGYEPNVPVGPKFRFMHNVNTMEGSSGGPCFDRNFSFVGIHQGAWNSHSNGNGVNRAIPIDAIVDDFEKKISDLPAIDSTEYRTWRLTTRLFEPVIGYDDFQQLIWEKAVSKEGVIIPISGDEGSGKSFLSKLAETLLPNDKHLKIVCYGEVVNRLSVLTFAGMLCAEAGAALPDIVPLATYTGTAGAWLRDEVVPAIIGAWAGRRNERMVWLMIRNMNNYQLHDVHCSDLLYLLYEQVKINPWLRATLDGIESRLPSSVLDVTTPFKTRAIELDDILRFFNRAFAEMNIQFGEDELLITVKLIYKKYWPKNSPHPAPGALEQLVQDCSDLLNEIISNVKTTNHGRQFA